MSDHKDESELSEHLRVPELAEVSEAERAAAADPEAATVHAPEMAPEPEPEAATVHAPGTVAEPEAAETAAATDLPQAPSPELLNSAKLPELCAVFVAGGVGSRFGNPGGKQLVEVCSLPLLSWSILTFSQVECVKSMVLVCPEDKKEEFFAQAVAPLNLKQPVYFAPSQSTRQESSASGFKQVPATAQFVAVHDGARPLIRPQTIERACRLLAQDSSASGVVCGHPCVDTLKCCDGTVFSETVDRDAYWAVQTPQIFRKAALKQAFDAAFRDGFGGTDDASLLERLSYKILCCPSERDNLKVTVPEDLTPVRAILSERLQNAQASSSFVDKLGKESSPKNQDYLGDGAKAAQTSAPTNGETQASKEMSLFAQSSTPSSGTASSANAVASSANAADSVDTPIPNPDSSAALASASSTLTSSSASAAPALKSAAPAPKSPDSTSAPAPLMFGPGSISEPRRPVTAPALKLPPIKRSGASCWVPVLRPPMIRIGKGYDAHRLVQGRKLVLGGVELNFEQGLLGHSDADVLCHAIADAILSAMRKGDIGKLFPDTDERYRGASSLKLLGQVGELMHEEGFILIDLDCLLVLEKPKISPYRDAMRKNIARVLSVSPDQVGIKASTTEGMGFEGSGEGASASAVVLLQKQMKKG